VSFVRMDARGCGADLETGPVTRPGTELIGRRQWARHMALRTRP
jgi:hypothetical protein